MDAQEDSNTMPQTQGWQHLCVQLEEESFAESEKHHGAYRFV